MDDKLSPKLPQSLAGIPGNPRLLPEVKVSAEIEIPRIRFASSIQKILPKSSAS